MKTRSGSAAAEENWSVTRRNALHTPSPCRFHGVCGGSYSILPVGSCFCFPLGKSLQDKIESTSGSKGTRWGLWSQTSILGHYQLICNGLDCVGPTMRKKGPFPNVRS